MTLFRRATLILTGLIVCFSSNTLAFAANTPLYNDKGSLMSQISRIAGSGLYGEEDGISSIASFRQPGGLVLGANNELYIADTGNHKIRKLSSGTISTYAGPLSSILTSTNGEPLGALLNGKKESSMFNMPADIAYGADGSLYVADSNNNVIRKITSKGEVITLAGNGKIGAADGKGATATFNHPQGIAVAASGIIYVADTLNHVIRKINPDGTTSTLTAASHRVVESYPGVVLSSGEYQDGPLKTAWFNEPTGLALDAGGNLYVSDSGNQRIRYINFKTNQVSTAAGGIKADKSSVYGKDELYATGGYKNGNAQTAAFNFPKGITVDASGGLLIADSLNNAIRYLKNGTVITLAGDQTGNSGLQDGIESKVLFDSPRDVVITSDETIYVADSGNNMIRSISPYRLPAKFTKNPSTISVVLENKQILFDAQPEMKNGRVMVPVRQIAEALGYKLTFGMNGQLVRLEKNNSSIELYMGSKTITHKETGGVELKRDIDAAPYVYNSRTYVPLRFFAEEIEMDVQWAGIFQTAIIRNK